MQKYFAAVFLMFASLFFVPLVGLAPLALLVFPFPAFIVVGLHVGLGAILVRETVARRNKGFASLISLGAACALILHGLGTQSFYDPQSGIAKSFGSIGWVGGANVLWALWITLISVAFNIAAPIIFTDALFPETAGRLGVKTLAILFLLFVADTVVLMSIPNYHPSRSAVSVVIVLIFVLIVVGMMLPSFSLWQGMSMPRDLAFFIGGFLGTAAFVILNVLFHNLGTGLAVRIPALIGVLALYCWLLLWLPALPQRSKVALAAGVYSGPTAIAILTGNFLPAVIAIVLMIGAWYRAKKMGGIVSLKEG